MYEGCLFNHYTDDFEKKKVSGGDNKENIKT